MSKKTCAELNLEQRMASEHSPKKSRWINNALARKDREASNEKLTDTRTHLKGLKKYVKEVEAFRQHRQGTVVREGSASASSAVH